MTPICVVAASSAILNVRSCTFPVSSSPRLASGGPERPAHGSGRAIAENKRDCFAFMELIIVNKFWEEDMKKNIVLALITIFICMLPGTCWAELYKPFGDIRNQQQAVDKLFAGRTLDPIEGIWVLDNNHTIAIARTAFGDNPKYKNSDYLGIEFDEQKAGAIYVWLHKTQYSFCFRGDGTFRPYCQGVWKLLSPTILLFDGNNSYAPAMSFIRIYPAP